MKQISVPSENIKRVCDLKEGDVFTWSGTELKVLEVSDRIYFRHESDTSKGAGHKYSFGLNCQMKIEITKQ